MRVEIRLKKIIMNSNQLPQNEYSKFNATYINALDNVNLLEELEICLHDFIKFVQNIPIDKVRIVMLKESGLLKTLYSISSMRSVLLVIVLCIFQKRPNTITGF